MSESFYFEDATPFTVGTLGPKGQRAFYLQCRSGTGPVSFKVEKQQVAALAESLDRMLGQLPPAEMGELPTDLDLREPVVAAFTVGALGVAYDREEDRVILVAEELITVEDDPRDPPVDIEAASARFTLSREQVAALVSRARSIVAAGRPPCPFCARPLEEAHGGWCPCHN